jgi:hypothetical protein
MVLFREYLEKICMCSWVWKLLVQRPNVYQTPLGAVCQAVPDGIASATPNSPVKSTLRTFL